MHMIGYRAVKNPVRVKQKTKIAYNFYVTKTADLKSPLKKDVETRNMCHMITS